MSVSQLEKIVKLTRAQYDSMMNASNHTISYSGGTHTYSPNNLYFITDEAISVDSLGNDFILDVPHGGTGKNTVTAGSVLVGNGTSALSELAATDQNTANTLVKRDANGDFSSGLIRITRNNNTVTIGSQNSGWCHIYNSQNWPFIFNNSVAATGGASSTATLGTASYPFHQLFLGGTTNSTMTASSANPRITFQEGTGTQPVHLIYTDADAYRAPAGLKIIGGSSATPAWFEVEGSIYANSGYRVPHTGNTTGTLGSATKPVYVDAGELKECTELKALAYKDSLTATDIPNLSWNKITSDKPTTLSGYGITDAATSGHTHTLKIGNKSLAVGTSEQTWSVHDILYNSTTSISTSTSWDIIAPGIYHVGSSTAFTGTQHPSSNGNQNAPYPYGHLIVTRANGYGAAQFYIAHTASGTQATTKGIRYRSGWNVDSTTKTADERWQPWATIIDDKNYNLYSPKLDGTGATGSWSITADKATKDASGNTITTTYATKTEVNGLLAAADALVFKGTIGTNGTITSVPNGTIDNTYQAGYTYRVITEGEYAGITCEIGDLLIAIADSTTGQTEVNNAHWTVAQTNIDGAVFMGSNSFTNGQYLVADGITGKVKTQSLPTATNSIPGITTIGAAGSAAAYSHGNHVPTVETANDIRFLRNDNSWHTLTSANVSTLINLLATGDSELTANDYVITQYVGGGTTTTSYHRRKASKVVNATLVKAALGTTSTTAKKFLKDTGSWTQVDWGDLINIPSTFSPTSHTHGNLQNNGALQTNDITIANGDKLVVTDSSDSNKVARTSLSFDGSTTTQALSKKGTWESFAAATHTHSTQQLTRPNQLKGMNDVTLQSLVSTVRANRLAFLPASQIIIEKTIDGGTTWTDAGVSDANKTSLFSEQRPGIAIPLIDGVRNVNCGLRITFTAMKYNVPEGTTETNKYNYWSSTYVTAQERYCQLKEFYFWLSSSSDGISVKVQRATGASPNNWTTIFENNEWAATGWSGNDYVRFAQATFGGSTNQTTQPWNYRIIFFTRDSNGGTNLSTSSTTQSQVIQEIRGYGDTWWTRSNNLMAEDRLYTFDSSKNATFPANLTATKFIGPLQGTADKATAANLTTTKYGIAYYSNTTGTFAGTGAGTTGQFLQSNGDSSAPAWATISKSTLGLGNVENTALSTWTGTNTITTVGTISTGTWQGTTIGISYGGTGTNSAPNAYGVIYAASTSAYASTAAGTAGSPFVGAGSDAPKWYDGLSLTGLGTDASPYNATFSNTVTIGGKLTLNGAQDSTGILHITNTTQSTSNATGALIVDGGVGIAKNATITGMVGIGTVVDSQRSSGTAQLVVQDYIKLAHDSGSTKTNLLHIKYDSTADVHFYPNSDKKGYIGLSTNRWNSLYLYNTFNLNDSVSNSTITDTISGTTNSSAHTSELLVSTVNTGTGSYNKFVKLSTGSSTPATITLGTSTTCWYLKNDAGVFSLTDGSTATISGTTSSGFQLTSKLYINTNLNSNYDLSVNGGSKLLGYVGIGTDNDNIRGSTTKALLVVQDLFKLVHDASGTKTDIINMDYTTVSSNIHGRIYPVTDARGVLGISTNRWASAYFSDSISVVNNSVGVTISSAGTVGINATTATLELFSSTANVTDWYLKNNAGVLTFIDSGSSNNTSFSGKKGSASGWEASPRIYIGDTIPTSGTVYALKVTGTTYLNGNVTTNGIQYFANGTTYQIDNSGNAVFNHVGMGGASADTTFTLDVTGQTRLNNDLVIKNNTQKRSIFMQNNAGNATGTIEYNQGHATNISSGQWSFMEYSPKTTIATTSTGKKETYSLPAVTAGLSADANYSILTTKNTVTTAQGGTGNTSYTASRLLYTSSATTLASSNIESDGSYITAPGTIKVSKTSTPTIKVQDPDSSIDCSLYIDSTRENHGVISTGYATYNSNNNTFAYTQNSKWLIWRNGAGQIRINAAFLSGTTSLMNDTVNLTSATNNVSEDTGVQILSKDVNGYAFASFRGVAKANGDVSVWLGTCNRDINGTEQGWRGIQVISDKSGNCSYTVSYPAKFREAIGLIGESRNVQWIGGRDGARIKTTVYNGYDALISAKTTNATWDLGAYDEHLYVNYFTDTNYSNNTNTASPQYIFKNSGYFSAPGIQSSEFITAGGGGLLAYKPANWTGVSSSQWGLGTADAQGVIRSNNNNLIHYKGGTNYVILDTSNYFQGKDYSYEYTVAANSVVDITGTNLGVSTPSGFTGVAMTNIRTNNNNVVIRAFRADVTGGNVVVSLRNLSSSQVKNTVQLRILYLRTS